MEIHDELVREMHQKICDIDLCIKGDDARGLKGIKQQLESFNSQIEAHESDDNLRFNSHERKLDELSDAHKKNRWFMAGVSAAVTVIFSLIVAIIELLK